MEGVDTYENEFSQEPLGKPRGTPYSSVTCQAHSYSINGPWPYVSRVVATGTVGKYGVVP